MIGASLLMLSLVSAAKLTANDIIVECRENYDLKAELVTFNGTDMINISWAINIDASIDYLTATRILAGGQTYHCEYTPPLAKADLTGSKQKWFHHLVYASYGLIQAANIPLPPRGSGPCYKHFRVTKPPPNPDVKPEMTQVPVTQVTQVGPQVPHIANLTSIILTIFGCLAVLMILSFSYLIYKRFGVNLAMSLDFKGCPSPMLPVPVLVVYPAENPTFQRAVVALTEFLQWQGGCSIAVDIWQQRKIAEQGPMCWLAEQVKAANRVLIVCPQRITPVLYSGCSSNNCFPTLSISAAAQDLYPLVLNMVVSHAKSSTNLSKFWVVQLGNQPQESGNLAPELKACKTFCVMKDLRKLCRSLHEHRQDNKTISAQISRPWIAYSEKSTMLLRKAVEKIK
ncbi:uncharacterized protein il17rb isoform X2 [Halichoeres trimaculatus]|uniref:uncharacterized protein il17rb isoform X2 n=1 Tax=Halichoeres trimaculatus TaxID=147232 RepID=UPI003D9ED76C